MRFIILRLISCLLYTSIFFGQGLNIIPAPFPQSVRILIYHPPTYFDNQYEDEWITNELSIRMIKDVDKSEVISSHLIPA